MQIDNDIIDNKVTLFIERCISEKVDLKGKLVIIDKFNDCHIADEYEALIDNVVIREDKRIYHVMFDTEGEAGWIRTY